MIPGGLLALALLGNAPVLRPPPVGRRSRPPPCRPGTRCLEEFPGPVAVEPQDGLAPLGQGIAGEGAAADLVVRAEGAPVAGRPAALRLLASDARTDAPLTLDRIELRAFGPDGSAPIELRALPGRWPGHYLGALVFPEAGSYALVASLPHASGADLIALSGLAVATPTLPARPAPWGWLTALLAFALLVLALGVRSRPAALAFALFCCSAGDAAAHGTFTPPPAAIPGAVAELSQELQFALGLRTAPAEVAIFFPPPGEEGGSADRRAEAEGPKHFKSSGAPRKSLGIPREALVERDGHKLIFVRTAPERFVAREPRLGWISGGEVAVLQGLEPGELVVVRGAGFLRNGGAR